MARKDIHTLVVRRGDYVLDNQRRLCHFRFSDRLERTTVNYANVVQNVVKAAQTRVFVESPAWNPPHSFTRVLNRAANTLGPQVGPELDEAGIEEILSRFPPKKRELYRDALRQILELPRHAACTGFVKQENVPLKDADKPRVIQFRNPVFLAHLLAAMKPLEHAFYHNRHCFNKFQRITCAKGLNPLQRMTQLEFMVSSLVNPVFIGLDGSAFDAHVSQGALRAEWKFYLKVLKGAGYHPRTIDKLRRMGECQLNNKVFFRCDDGTVKYKVKGNRMSGDLNTGLGNSVLQSLFIATAMAECGVPERHWRMLVDGDDAVLMVSGEYVPNVSSERIRSLFAQFSQDVKVEGYAPVDLNNMEPIDFCQSRPVRVDGHWRLIRDPKKVYNGYKQQVVYYRSVEEAGRFMATIAPPEMIYASGVPVHEELFKLFHRLGGDSVPLESVSRRFWLRQTSTCSVKHSDHVSWSTRDSYARAFGMTVLEQLQAEEELRCWTRSDFLAARLSVVA